MRRALLLLTLAACTEAPSPMPSPTSPPGKPDLAPTVPTAAPKPEPKCVELGAVYGQFCARDLTQETKDIMCNEGEREIVRKRVLDGLDKAACERILVGISKSADFERGEILLASLRRSFCGDEEHKDCPTWIDFIEDISFDGNSVYIETRYYPKDENRSPAMILATSACRADEKISSISVRASSSMSLAIAICEDWRPTKRPE